MRVLRRQGVTVWISDDVYAWPGHRREIQEKVNELAELLYSLETGRTERIS